MTTVGFVGLGAMGLPMARNLVERQFRVRGFDLKREALESLASAGGTATASAAEAATGADVLVLMVVNAAQAESVLFAGGALDAMAPGGGVVLMATCPPGAVSGAGRSYSGDGTVPRRCACLRRRRRRDEGDAHDHGRRACRPCRDGAARAGRAR